MKRITESNKKEIFVVYVSSIGSSIQVVTEKNYSDVEDIFDAAWDDIEKQQGADLGEIWIDDCWVDGMDVPSGIDWKDLLTDKKGQLDPDMIEKIFEDNYFAIKAGFIIEKQGKGTNIEEYLDEVQVYDAKRDNWVKGGYDNMYPEDWMLDYVEEMYPDLYKLLDKYNSGSYFNWASLLTDNELNGDFSSSKMDDYFVYVNGRF